MLKRLNPAVKKNWLYLLSGIVWSGVGIMLTSKTPDWLAQAPQASAMVKGISGILLALIIYRFGFSPMALKNIDRIKNKATEHLCIFGFQKWSSYPLVAVMIAMGIFLRKYSPIPKPWLAILYIGIGGGLLLSSFWYYQTIFSNWRAQHGTPSSP